MGTEQVMIAAGFASLAALAGYLLAALRYRGETQRQAASTAQLQQRAEALARELAEQSAVRRRHLHKLRALELELHDVAIRNEALEQSGLELKAANAANMATIASLNEARHQAEMAGESLRVALHERELSHARELEQFEQQKQRLTEQFKLLSADILAASTQSLQESSKHTLAAVMGPFQQSMEAFKREVQEIHHRETTQQGELRSELEQLKSLNQRITQEAHELSTALRGQKKLQGNWGELILENVLERSGLQAGTDFRREVSISSDEGRRRPDAIVYLPQGKHLIIDAKVSLNAYTRYVNAESDAERLPALKQHVDAIRQRIRELGDRDYFQLPGLNAPEMVFMFIPIESAFVEALKSDETLFQHAIEQHVLVATPTTLLTSLNIVRQLWRHEEQNKHTLALARKADTVFRKLSGFLASFEAVKRSLDQALDAYEKAENQLVSGKGNLVKQVGDFKKLAPAIRGELPAHLAEKAELEIDIGGGVVDRDEAAP